MKVYSPGRIKNGIGQRWSHFNSNQRWNKLLKQVFSFQTTPDETRPVVFFNASTRLQSMSQNAAYSLLASLGLRANGIPVHYFICKAGLERCVLGSDRDDVYVSPPCELCTRQSRQVFSDAPVTWLVSRKYPDLKNELQDLPLQKLIDFKKADLPLGFWAVNSLRWVLRRHHLVEDESTLVFMRAFILGGWNVYQQFTQLVDNLNPQAVVVFNGMFYPEAAVRQTCLEKNVRVITHEVGIQPMTGFFTNGEATAYPLDIPPEFELTPKMNARLDEYLSKRFKGDFTMAGIKFWPQIEQVDETLKQKMAGYKKIVPVFTNVIFDTSQVHANTIFATMFDWLGTVEKAIKQHPDILFVLRAHPDEGRKGKESRESVAQWVEKTSLDLLPNVVFIDTDEMVSSYELIQRSHFVMVYNSTIGLEAILMGKNVLTAARARYTQIPTTIHPNSPADYVEKLESLLNGDQRSVPAEFIRNARRFLYKQLFMSSLPFDRFLETDHYWKGYVTLKKKLTPAALAMENSETIKVILEGIRFGKPFELKP